MISSLYTHAEWKKLPAPGDTEAYIHRGHSHIEWACQQLRNFRCPVAMADCWLRMRGRRGPSRESEAIWSFADNPRVVHGMVNALQATLHQGRWRMEDVHAALQEILGEGRIYPFETYQPDILLDWTGGRSLLVKRGIHPVVLEGFPGGYTLEGDPQDVSLFSTDPIVQWVSGRVLIDPRLPRRSGIS